MNTNRVTRIKNGVIFFRKLIQSHDKWDSDLLRKWLPSFIDLVSEHVDQEPDVEEIFGSPSQRSVGLTPDSVGQDTSLPHAVKL